MNGLTEIFEQSSASAPLQNWLRS